MEEKKDGIDYALFAEDLDQIREVLNAQVAALVADGFTDQQAREIITAFWRMSNSGEGDK